MRNKFVVTYFIQQWMALPKILFELWSVHEQQDRTSNVSEIWNSKFIRIY